MDVKHVAKLANLSLKDEEIPIFETQLSDIIDYIKQLEEVDTSSIEPTSQTTGLENVLRTDESRDSLTQEDVLVNSSGHEKGQFKVKAVLE